MCRVCQLVVVLSFCTTTSVRQRALQLSTELQNMQQEFRANELYWVEDMMLTCFNGQHKLPMILSIVGLPLLVGGLPLYLFYLLYKNRHVLESDPKVWTWAFVW